MDIIAVKKNEDGDNVSFKLSNNKVVSMEEAISLCESGKLSGYNVGTSKAGTKFIRGNADGNKTNNLDNMPTF